MPRKATRKKQLPILRTAASTDDGSAITEDAISKFAQRFGARPPTNVLEDVQEALDLLVVAIRTPPPDNELLAAIATGRISLVDLPSKNPVVRDVYVEQARLRAAGTCVNEQEAAASRLSRRKGKERQLSKRGRPFDRDVARVVLRIVALLKRMNIKPKAYRTESPKRGKRLGGNLLEAVEILVTQPELLGAPKRAMRWRAKNASEAGDL